MEKKYKNGLFIFRRDFRIEDNVGFNNALNICENLYTCFIFTPEQIGNKNNYKSNNSIQFMIESIFDLKKEIEKKKGELLFFYGKNDKIISKLISLYELNVVVYNKDYTPYAVYRDNIITDICSANNVEIYEYHDYCLYEPCKIININGSVYKKFTPFYEKVIEIKVNKPKYVKNMTGILKSADKKKIKCQTSLETIKRKILIENEKIIVNGGREKGIQQLVQSLETQENYEKTRNYLRINTSILSPYLKFGCISVREVYYFFLKNFGKKSEIMRQLIWRDFYMHIMYSYPAVLNGSLNHEYYSKNGKLFIKYNPKTSTIEEPQNYNKQFEWDNNEIIFKKWCNGETGFPIVDACMKQLNETGWMHNRGRLIVSGFLIKILLIDWRFGELYFSKKLIDYDIASNNGNWQWMSSSGITSTPYYQILNPWVQSEKFDKNGEFIKKWIPELKEVNSCHLHKWNEWFSSPKYKSIDYPSPIVDFNKQKEKYIKLYKNIEN